MSNAIRRSRERGGAGGRHKAALARLHSARVAQSRRRASLPGAGGRRLPLWGGAPPLKRPVNHQSRVNLLVKYFGAKRIKEITYADLEAYRKWLIDTPTRYKKPRSVYDTNHQLRQLRVLLNYAVRQQWLPVNPFHQGEPLIHSADEIPRDREQREGELELLLTYCVGRRAHLRVLVLLGIDTALRPTEMLRLCPSQIDFEQRHIVALATKTKTNRRRVVPLTDRLAAELRAWLDGGLLHWLQYQPLSSGVDLPALLANPETTIFGNIQSVKGAWIRTCREAGIEDLKLKDLRHWGITRMLNVASEAGIASEHVQKISGHTQVKTFQRYLNTGKNAVQAIGDLLNRANTVSSTDSSDKKAE